MCLIHVDTHRWTVWRANGKSVGTYKDGKEEGVWTLWHENGQKKAESTWKNGKKEGVSTTWYDNGQKWLELSLIHI